MFEKSMSRRAKGKLVLHVSDDDMVKSEEEQKVDEDVVVENKEQKEDAYKINKRPKHDVSDNEAEEEAEVQKKTNEESAQ